MSRLRSASSGVREASGSKPSMRIRMLTCAAPMRDTIFQLIERHHELSAEIDAALAISAKNWPRGPV